jgi:hypothetical protein
MSKVVQHGGFFFAIFAALFQFIAFVLQLVFMILKVLWQTGLIQRFVKFCLISSFVLSIFGFFGIFVTFAGIIYIYIRQIMEIRKENNILRDYSRQTQGLPPAIN